MKPPLSLIPLLPVLAALAAGILFEGVIDSAWWVVVPAVVSVVSALAGRKAVAVYGAVLTAGWLLAILARPATVDVDRLNGNFKYEGTVSSIEMAGTSRRAIVEIDTRYDAADSMAVVPVRCCLTVYSLLPEIAPGDRVRFEARFSGTSTETDLPDEPVMDGYYYRNSVAITATVVHDGIAVTGRAGGMLWNIRRFREEVAGLIASAPLSSGTMDFLAAVLLGDESMLPADVRRRFSSAGVAHVLALSGLHVAILAYVIAVALFPLTLCGWRRVRWIVTIALLWIYAVMTGLSPSVTRAVIMATMVLASYLIQRRNNAFNALCCAAVVILVFSPRSLYSVGFQLTFAAVASIMLFNSALRVPYIRNAALRWIVECVTVAVGAVIGTGVLSAYYFHEFPLGFLLANIPVTLILPFLMVAGVAVVVSVAAGWNVGWLGGVTDRLHDLICDIVDVAVSVPGSTLHDIYFPGWMVIPVYLSAAIVVAAIYYRNKTMGLWGAAAVLLTVTSFALWQPSYPRAGMYIARTAYSTQILVKENRNLYMITTASDAERGDVVASAALRYDDYMRRRGIDSLTVVGDTLSTPLMFRRGRQLVVGDSYFVIVNDWSDVRPSFVKPRYALVCRGFKGNICDVADVVAPDTVILSRDLHPRRCRRYADSLAVRGLPFISLHERRFTIQPQPEN